MQRCIRLVYHVKTAYRTDDQRCRKEAYGQSAVSVVSKWKANQKPTDIARVALTLSAMGKDITNVGGVNLAAMLYSSDRLEDGSNELSWTLIALDATSQKIPADAKWNRESMIDALLGFQNENSGLACLTTNQQV